jgi:predicted PurR-regulated permease PerM
MGEIARTVAHWILGTAIVSAILMVIYSAGFAIAGVPWWLLVGFVCGALQLIPIAGPSIALLLVTAVSWFGTQNVWVVGGAIVTFVIAQALESFLLTPRIIGRRLNVSPFLIFAAVLLGGIFLGPVGVVFAAPAAAIGMILWRRYGRKPRPCELPDRG